MVICPTPFPSPTLKPEEKSRESKEAQLKQDIKEEDLQLNMEEKAKKKVICTDILHIHPITI